MVEDRACSVGELDIVLAQLDDAAELVELRIRAMKPSLEAVGRFDPERAKQRFLTSFDPQCTFKLMCQNALLGFYVLVKKVDHLWLDHLYIDPQYQGNGLGERVLSEIKQQCISTQQEIRLGALIDSRANAFYLAQGFVQVEQQEWDNIYRWYPDSSNLVKGENIFQDYS